ncbi:hypothetical protein P8C59_003209 [Phyllachora maydis]|uniref:Uncharacterized protein n=1 Tax=Phyllachora maydis TaxID=1825666 RepID=A0AAD9I1B0_9PEZI|nr:hypothetical protein P8C59_003209 [Phyllachora maydis]
MPATTADAAKGANSATAKAAEPAEPASTIAAADATITATTATTAITANAAAIINKKVASSAYKALYTITKAEVKAKDNDDKKDNNDIDNKEEEGIKVEVEEGDVSLIVEASDQYPFIGPYNPP